jgi:hypothetical protein
VRDYLLPYPKVGYTSYEEIVKNSTITNFYGYYQSEIDSGAVYKKDYPFNDLIKSNEERGISPVW